MAALDALVSHWPTEARTSASACPYFGVSVIGVLLFDDLALDDLDVADVLPFEAAFLDHRRRNPDILDTIESTGQFTDETEEALVKAVEAFRRTFASGEQMLGAQVAEPEEEPTAERTTEQLVVKRG